MNKAILKYNNGKLALLCSRCSVIIKTGKEFTEKENKYVKGLLTLPPMYCDKCKQIKTK